MILRWRLAVGIGLLLSAAACSSLLGLGDFKNASPDGGGGQGAGGTEGGAGAAGSAGGPGSLTCTNVGGPVDLFTPSDLKDKTVQQLFAVNDSQQAYVVVVAGQANPGGIQVAVQTIRDSIPLHKGQIQQNLQTQFSHFQQPWVSSNGVHLWGGLGNELGELTFPLTSGQLQPTPGPTYPVQTPPKCVSGGTLVSAAFSGQGDPPHVAATCQVNATDAGPPTQYLYVDDVPVGNATGNDTPFAIRHYLYVNGTHVLITGPDFGPPLYVSYGPTPSQLSTPKLFSLSTGANQFSVLADLEPLPANGGMMAFGAVLTGSDGGPPPIVPATLLTRSVSVSQLDQLVANPATGFSTIVSITNARDAAAFGVPMVLSNELLYAGSNPISSNNVHMMILSREGKVLLPNTLVYSLPSASTTTISFAAAAQAGLHTLVVWVENQPGPDGGTVDRVRGRFYSCR